MSGLIVEPGVYDLLKEQYEADLCIEPSLRSSTAWKLVAKGSTPAHAAYTCQRLNPNYRQEPKRHFNIGSACHAVLLGKGARLRKIEGTNYNTNEPNITKAEKTNIRDAAYVAGEIPLLLQEYQQVMDMADRAREQFADLVKAGTIDAPPFSRVETEKTLYWQEGSAWCRAQIDGLPDDGENLDEYKTDGQSADPQLWQWKMRKLGYAFRVSFYRRGLEKLKLAFSPQFRFFIQETEPPYLLSFVRLDDELIAQEDEKVRAAIKVWQRCMDTGHWPGYNVEGYDIGLTEKEKYGDAMQQVNNPQSPYFHLSSEDVV